MEQHVKVGTISNYLISFTPIYVCNIGLQTLMNVHLLHVLNLEFVRIMKDILIALVYLATVVMDIHVKVRIVYDYVDSLFFG